jgi:hypothetical protein
MAVQASAILGRSTAVGAEGLRHRRVIGIVKLAVCNRGNCAQFALEISVLKVAYRTECVVVDNDPTANMVFDRRRNTCGVIKKLPSPTNATAVRSGAQAWRDDAAVAKPIVAKPRLQIVWLS